jgi:hypothetical protein
MNALNSLQRLLQSYVLQGKPEIRERVGSIDPERRLRIYYDAYRLRLIEALATDYEALREYMGAEGFDAACRTYVERTPSSFRNVRWYGAGLPAFLRDTHPFAQLPILAEIALFEWMLTLAFDARDLTALSFDDLAAIPGDAWPMLTFALHPCVQLIDLRTNAPAFRKAADAGEALPAVVVADEPTPWLIWRSSYTPCFRSLSQPEAWALRAVQSGADFTRLCEGLCDWLDPEAAAPHAAGFLRQWVNDALIVRAVH